MDFKDRFKGRTSTIGKVGVIDTLASAANPVQKSQSNSQFTSYNKAIGPGPVPEDLPKANMTNKVASHHSVDSRPPMPLQASNSYSRSPGGYSSPNQNYPPRLPTGLNNPVLANNPYMVSNPMPALDVMDNKHYRSQDNSPDVHNRLDGGTKQYQQHHTSNTQNVVVSQFNPNSFYNQHSQFKNGLSGLTPKKENIDQSNSYIPVNGSQQYQKNFENHNMQNKQKRTAEEVLRGFDNQITPQRGPNGRYEGYEQAVQNQRPPQSMPGYSGYREIHSNPVPQSYGNNNAFNYTPQSMTYQNDRRQQPYEESNQQYMPINPDPLRYSGQSKTAYKPYSIKDYKDMKMRTPVNLGGLGPNTNTDEWYKEREKRDKMAEFSQNVKLFNAQRIPATDIGFKPRKDKDKERSRREIALEFAKNIPKPRPRKYSPSLEEDTPPQRSSKRPESETRVNYRSAIGGDLDELEQRHNQYVAQLERMKYN